MLDLCRRERAAIWHGHDYKSNLLGLLLNRFWPMRLMTTVHGWVRHTQRTPLYYGIDRFCLPRFERVICVSEDLVDQCRACGVAADRCVLIENGIDVDEYRRTLTVADAKARIGIALDELTIGAVGRLSPEKGFDVLIRAADGLVAEGLPVRLVIVGEGDDAPRLQTLIDELGHGDRFQLLGYRPDTITIYQALDVFALSSFREGLPNVVLEAMALEVPVVASRVAGVPRVIQDGENGVLVEPADCAGLTRALRRVLSAPGLRQVFGRAGRESIVRRYSFAARMHKVRAIYDSFVCRN